MAGTRPGAPVAGPRTAAAEQDAPGPRAAARGARPGREVRRRALVDDLRADLTSAGARPRRVETGLDALTPAEYRTAVLAAEGLTNQEIADRLFVTRRTVELHLTRVYRKLSLSGRADLPAAVAGQVTAADHRSLRRVGTDGPASPPRTARRSTRLRPAS